MAANKPKQRSNNDPVEDQLRFEAALYGDWYSRSIYTSYVRDQSDKRPGIDASNERTNGLKGLPEDH
tara:strand:+ start:717 stop:917 length:201 start_codon:yes stop_codon:yes gene_type:complete